MKKLDAERKVYLERAALARWENSLKRKGRRNQRYSKYGAKSDIAGWRQIVAPASIDLYAIADDQKSYVETLEFIDDIEANLGRVNCYVDFSHTTAVTAAALVAVYAAVDTALSERKGKGKVKVVLSEKAENVNAHIRNYNLHGLLTGGKADYSLAGVRIMPVMSGVGDEYMGDIIDFIQKKIYMNKMDAETEFVYSDAVSETIYNVELHAYPKLPDSEKRWWLMCRAKGKMLHLAIYDKGVGIPKTVVDHPWFINSLRAKHPKEHDILLEKFPELKGNGFDKFIPSVISDEKLIYLSLQGDISGTKEDKHGQGSKSIMALVNDTAGGRLWVFSNDGLCKYEQAGDEPELMVLPKTFPGTLIQWNIELP